MDAEQNLDSEIEILAIAPSMEKIERLEDLILQLPQAELPVTHEFLDCLYARSMLIPAGVVLTGATHKYDNFLFVRYGDITILTEDGCKRFKAGDMISSKAGIKRAMFSHEDTLITTMHNNPTNETDEDVLWNIFTNQSNNLLETEKPIILEAIL